MSEKEMLNEKEFEQAENEAKQSTNVYQHKLNKPFTYEGKTYNELIFDFGKLTGEDALAIEEELSSLGKTVIAPEFSGAYLIRLACKACNEPIGSDVLAHLPIADFNKIRSRARSFLLHTA